MKRIAMLRQESKRFRVLVGFMDWSRKSMFEHKREIFLVMGIEGPPKREKDCHKDLMMIEMVLSVKEQAWVILELNVIGFLLPQPMSFEDL